MRHEFENTEDFVTDDDFLNPQPKKKKSMEKRKAIVLSLDLVTTLNNRFGTGFSRSVGSGIAGHKSIIFPNMQEMYFRET
jgi:hypothetical protein